jgi:hypothetical protein
MHRKTTQICLIGACCSACHTHSHLHQVVFRESQLSKSLPMMPVGHASTYRFVTRRSKKKQSTSFSRCSPRPGIIGVEKKEKIPTHRSWMAQKKIRQGSWLGIPSSRLSLEKKHTALIDRCMLILPLVTNLTCISRKSCIDECRWCDVSDTCIRGEQTGCFFLPSSFPSIQINPWCSPYHSSRFPPLVLPFPQPTRYSCNYPVRGPLGHLTVNVCDLCFLPLSSR